MVEPSRLMVLGATSMGLLSFKWRGANSMDPLFARLEFGVVHTFEDVDLALIAPGEVLAFPPKSRLSEVAELFGERAGECPHSVTDLTPGWCALDVTGTGSSQAISNLGGVPRRFLFSVGAVSAFWMSADRVVVRTILPDQHYVVWLSRSRSHSFPLKAAFSSDPIQP
jgi:hypothetical protein